MPDEKDLDLTREPPEGSGAPYEIEPYDPRPLEDSARRRIAYILLLMLAFVLTWALVTVTFLPSSEKSTMDILQIVLGPLVALVSAATGFYFGAKAR